MYSPYGAALLEHHHHHHHHFAMGGPIPPFLHSLMTTPPLQGHHRGFGPQHMLHHHHHHHHLSVHSTAAAFPSAAAFSTPIARQRTPSGNTLTPGRTVATAWMPASGNSASAMPPPGTKTSGGIAANNSLSSAQTNGELAAQQHPGTGAAPTTTSVSAERVNPLSGKTLERDLSHASKEELIQVLLDLSSCNYDASGFIHTKAQLFCLRSAVATKPCGAFATAAGSEVPRHVGHHTPSKSLFASQLTEGGTPDSCCYSAAAAATTGTRSAANTAPNSTSKDATIQSQPRRAMASGSPTTASSNSCGAAGAGNGSPYASSPIRELQQSLHDRHITPETRPFSSELHPCARLFGACRHSTNCVFRNLPNNLCLHWVRGCCSSGTECNYVHRLPNPCPSTVQAVFDLAHGQDRNHAAALRAAQEQQHQQHVTLPPPPAMTTPAKHTPSVAELSFSAYGGGLSTPTRDDQRTSRQLIMSESEGVPEEGGGQHDSGELVPAADPDTYHPSSVARTLDDSFERAAS